MSVSGGRGRPRRRGGGGLVSGSSRAAARSSMVSPTAAAYVVATPVTGGPCSSGPSLTRSRGGVLPFARFRNGSTK